MVRLFVVCVALSLASTAVCGVEAKPPQPAVPEPTEKASWVEVRRESESAIRAKLIDPDSARIRWASGFRWGSWGTSKNRTPAWTACGFVNAKNRMGGYTGEQVFIVAYNGRVLDTRTESPEHDYIFQMCVRTKVALQKELEGVSQPVEAAKAGHSIAEEIERLAALRDKGLLTDSEFNAQKIKLLNQVTPIN